MVRGKAVFWYELGGFNLSSAGVARPFGTRDVGQVASLWRAILRVIDENSPQRWHDLLCLNLLLHD
jgi:hypothetical protein